MTNKLNLNDEARRVLLESLPVCIGFAPEDIVGALDNASPDMNGIDPQELGRLLTENVLDALREVDLSAVIKDALAQCSGMDRDKWDASLSIDSESLFAEMLENGLNAEERHG